MPCLSLDHIVIAVPNLNNAIAFFQEHLAVKPIMGGRHIGLGTHNALFPIGSVQDRQYIELLAIDPEDHQDYSYYSMGLTPQMSEPFFASWCLRCEDGTNIHEISRVMPNQYSHGEARKMQRQKPNGEILSWQIALDQEKILASQGQVPFFIQWSNLELHPTSQFKKENFCDFRLNIMGPNTKELQQLLLALGFKIHDHILFSDSNTIQTQLILMNKDFYLSLNDRNHLTL